MDLLPLSLIRNDANSSTKLSGSGSGSSQTSSCEKIMSNNNIISGTERRKPNWTECENVFLLDQFSIHREILTCKATDASTNLRKQEVWRIICQNLNLQNTLVRRTPAEVRRKWKNLVTAAKKELWELRHQAHTTGSSRKISELSQRVIQLHSSSSSSNNTSALSQLFLLHQNNNMEDFKYNNNNNNEYDKVSEYFTNTNSNHFTPIIQLSESVSSPNCSNLSSTDSRNEFDSGIYEEATDLRVNINKSTIIERKMIVGNGNKEQLTQPNDSSRLKNTINNITKTSKDNELQRLRLELQIDVLKLRKRKLEIEVRRLRKTGSTSISPWRKYFHNKKF